MKRYLLMIFTGAFICMPTIAQEKDTAAPKTDTASIAAVDKRLSAPAQEKDIAMPPKNDASPFKFSGVVDMQVEKQLYEEYWSSSKTRIKTSNTTGYREAFDDFWMRVALKGSYQLKNLETVFNLRFYPYWTMRRQIYTDPLSGTTPPDLLGNLDVFEINQAYIKVFKDYNPQTDLEFRPSFKIGRDGLLNSCSQLFGNYLDQPAGGYGATKVNNVTGPFKNRKIFANQIEVGLTFNVFNIVGGATSLMIGGNLSNNNFYNTLVTQFFQLEDSKLSAGFFRAYQEIFLLNKRFHLGVGVRKYTAVQDTAGAAGYFTRPNYLTAQCAFDAAIVKDVKFYAELGMQDMSSQATTGVVRPINAGITIPTFGMVDTFAIEVENVATHYFDDESMRDPVEGRLDTRSLGWGIVLEKRYFDKLIIDWGLFTGNAAGDMKTTLRLTGLIN